MRRTLLRLVVVAIGLLILALIFGGRLISLYVDYLWFASLGYRGPYLTILIARFSLFGIGAALFLALYLPNVLLARALARRIAGGMTIQLVDPGGSGRGPFGGSTGGPFGSGSRPTDADRPRPFGDLAEMAGGPEAARQLLSIISPGLLLVIGVVLAGLLGLVAAGQWETVLRADHGVPFGVADPIFGHDVGFYVFALPVIAFWREWLLWSLILTGVICVALYGAALYTVDPELTTLRQQLLHRALGARRHVLALCAVGLLLVAGGTWMSTYDILVARHGRFVGANYTDLHVRLPATQAQAATTALVALLVVVSIWRRSYTLPLAGAVLTVVVFVLGRGALPALVQRLQVEPAEVSQERPYIAQNITFTRRAFGLEGMVEQSFPAQDTVRADEIRDNVATVRNIRLWDYRPLRDTYNQLQSIRPYYVFGDVDVDRYQIDGQYRQVMLSARELAPERIGAQAATWVNRRLQYTHGFGLVMSPVNQVAREGQPVYFVQDIPPGGRVPVERPEIYYGETTAGYAVVNTSVQEFDYPSGDSNVFTTYHGQGGVTLGPLWRRAALSWYFGDFNLLISTYLNQDSRILFRRGLVERVQRLMPYLKLDRDPYLVTTDGQLQWVIDAYTTTDRYPYAQLVQEQLPPAGSATATGDATGVVSRRVTYNYIRNSVKVVVNAYDGSIAAYIADPTDPVAHTYADIFPGLLQPLSAMPPALRSHLRYPEDLFRVQSQILTQYHVQDPQVFYNGEDVWAMPFEVLSGERAPVEPYYVIMRLPGETREEFLLMLPFTPASRDNMISWLAARSDGDQYGKLVLYKFPKDRLVYGPAQIDARINQEPAISAQLTLWNQQGSRVLRGNLLVIPIGASTLYVEPIYLQSDNSRLPELRRVVVATGSRLVMEPTLEEGVASLFGPDSGIAVPQPTTPPAAAPEPPPVTPAIGAAAREARAAYDRAVAALRNGDFAGFGDELKNLDQRLRDLEGAAPPP